MRKLEETFGPWSWATDVQFCSFDDGVTCKQVAGPFPGANGLLLSQDKSQIYVSDCKDAVAYIYNMSNGFNLSLERKIVLGAAPDNINVIPTTGDLLYAGK